TVWLSGRFVYIVIEVLQLLFAVFLVLGQVKVGAGVNTFHLLKTNRELVLYITGRICIVRQLHMVVVAVLLFSNTETQMPFHAFFFPEGIPFFLGARAHEEFHLHLLKFTHTKDELAGNDFIPKSLTDLRYTKGNFHPS